VVHRHHAIGDALERAVTDLLARQR